MQYADHRSRLRVEVDTKECDIPKDELTRMEESLAPLDEAVRDFATADLWVTVIRHPRNGNYHAELKLKLPGTTLFTSDWDEFLDTAYQRCLRKMAQRVNRYREHPDQQAEERAERITALDENIVAPEDPDAGWLGEKVMAGDYPAFRVALATYEEWLRKRVGRWLQRYPDAQAQVGRRLRIGDLVEEVYLNAFEHFAERPTDIRFSEWLDHLMDPSLKILLRHPDEEGENASMARSWWTREAAPR